MPDSNVLTVLRDGVTQIGALAKIIGAIFPNLASQTVATSATAGTNGAPPSQVKGYLTVTLPDGTTGKVPVYGL